MNCPECGEDMYRMGNIYKHINGDEYSYEWCNKCKEKYELIIDRLYGGEQYINCRCD